MNVLWPNERMAEYLNRLPFVAWDRCIRGTVEADGETFTFCDVYGWITRRDGQRDYVKIDFVGWSEVPGVSTSSAKHSAEIARLCNGANAPHFDCERVAEVFGDLVERTAA